MCAHRGIRSRARLGASTLERPSQIAAFEPADAWQKPGMDSNLIVMPGTNQGGPMPGAHLRPQRRHREQGAGRWRPRKTDGQRHEVVGRQGEAVLPRDGLRDRQISRWAGLSCPAVFRFAEKVSLAGWRRGHPERRRCKRRATRAEAPVISAFRFRRPSRSRRRQSAGGKPTVRGRRLPWTARFSADLSRGGPAPASSREPPVRF